MGREQMPGAGPGRTGLRAPAVALVVALAMFPVAALAGAAAQGECPPAPPPVIGLDFASRYAEGDATRSELDPTAAAAVEAALRPVEDFLRDLVTAANKALDAGDADAAACMMRRMAAWAGADALSDLGGGTAELTIGSRLAAFALVYLQLADLAGDTSEAAEVRAWLDRRVVAQIAYWETLAPVAARQGNLRAWAALAAAARAADTASPEAQRFAFWAGASAAWVLCSANADGSLPQEMRRGARALQYQLHALAPLAVTALLLERRGQPVVAVCNHALDRAVGFALDDLGDGAATKAITGVTQNFFDGSEKLKPFHLAWAVAYSRLPGARHGSRALAMATALGAPNYSKLGGNQTLVWGNGR